MHALNGSRIKTVVGFCFGLPHSLAEILPRVPLRHVPACKTARGTHTTQQRISSGTSLSNGTKMATPLGVISPNAKNIKTDNGMTSPRKAGLGQKKAARRTTTAGKENPAVVKTKVRVALTGWRNALWCIPSRWAAAVGRTFLEAAHRGPRHTNHRLHSTLSGPAAQLCPPTSTPTPTPTHPLWSAPNRT